MSTYYSRANSYSRSYNAHVAESEGREPATRAAQTWGFKSATDLRAVITSGEWHHVGKYANAVDYYDVAAWISGESSDAPVTLSGLEGVAKHLTKKGKELVLLSAVRRIVSDNLKAADPVIGSDYPKGREPWLRASRKGKRIKELEAKHGVSLDGYQGHLHPCEALSQFVEKQREVERLARIARKRSELRKRVQKNLAPPRRNLDESARAARQRIRFDALAAKFGRANSGRTRALLRKEGLPFTEANWKRVAGI